VNPNCAVRPDAARVISANRAGRGVGLGRAETEDE
jgi:hypothetical protein